MQVKRESASKRGQGVSWLALCALLAALALGLFLIALWPSRATEILSLLPLAIGVPLALAAAFIGVHQALAGRRLTALTEQLDASLESLKDLQWEVREREARCHRIACAAVKRWYHNEDSASMSNAEGGAR